jgi:hypothetical protein
MTSPPPSGRRLKAFGKYPTFLYRAYTKKCYAEDFALLGQFRLGNLRIYVDMENEERRDHSEGRGHFQSLGIVTSVDSLEDEDQVS